MEPMTLGSPGSPPASSISSPYLPSFLMGDPTPLSPGQPGSPTKTPRQVHFAPNLMTSINLSMSATPSSEQRNRSYSIHNNPPGEKTGGPPTVGLFDTLESTTVASPRSDMTSNSMTSPCGVNQSESWVTVFGFPPTATTAVIGQFSQIGHIVQHNFPGQGNWVNIQYSSRIEARRALAYNGRIFGGNIMVGVIPCRDPNVLKDVTNTGTPLTPKSPRSFSRRLTTPTTSPYITSPPSRPRSLIGPSTGDNEVLGAQNAPAKNTSIVSKTMDYIFGW